MGIGKRFIRLTIDEDNSGKIALEDFISAYENNDGYVISKHMPEFDSEKDNLIDSFEKNNQAYVVTESKKIHNIFFKTDTIFGNFTYSATNEEIVMDIINSIEFKSFEKQTEIKPRKTIKKVIKPTTEPLTEKIPETQPPVIETSPVQTVLHFILNLETSCIHIDPDCSAALKILPENYSTVDIADSDLLNYNGVYWACGKCSREYTNILPKF